MIRLELHYGCTLNTTRCRSAACMGFTLWPYYKSTRMLDPLPLEMHLHYMVSRRPVRITLHTYSKTAPLRSRPSFFQPGTPTSQAACLSATISCLGVGRSLKAHPTAISYMMTICKHAGSLYSRNYVFPENTFKKCPALKNIFFS